MCVRRDAHKYRMVFADQATDPRGTVLIGGRMVLFYLTAVRRQSQKAIRSNFHNLHLINLAMHSCKINKLIIYLRKFRCGLLLLTNMRWNQLFCRISQLRQYHIESNSTKMILSFSEEISGRRTVSAFGDVPIYMTRHASFASRRWGEIRDVIHHVTT